MARKRRKPLDFFRSFTRTVAREVAVRSVRRAEKTLGQRLRYWERRNEGRMALDPRRDVSGLTTQQLKAYARELNEYRGGAIRSAGVLSPSGNLLSEAAVADYEARWEARELEKEAWRAGLQIKGFDYDKRPMTLVDIDPRTGKPKPTYGGNYVLQKLGSVQLPDTSETLERRRQLMHGWRSIRSRLDTSEANLRRKLADNDASAVEKWDRLNRAQKQHLINQENFFDRVEAVHWSTDPKEDAAMKRAGVDSYDEKIAEIHRLLDEAARLEMAHPEMLEFIS